jgi:hypothetical protein
MECLLWSIRVSNCGPDLLPQVGAAATIARCRASNFYTQQTPLVKLTYNRSLVR